MLTRKNVVKQCSGLPVGARGGVRAALPVKGVGDVDEATDRQDSKHTEPRTSTSENASETEDVAATETPKRKRSRSSKRLIAMGKFCSPISTALARRAEMRRLSTEVDARRWDEALQRVGTVWQRTTLRANLAIVRGLAKLAGQGVDVVRGRTLAAVYRRLDSNMQKVWAQRHHMAETTGAWATSTPPPSHGGRGPTADARAAEPAPPLADVDANMRASIFNSIAIATHIAIVDAVAGHTDAGEGEHGACEPSWEAKVGLLQLGWTESFALGGLLQSIRDSFPVMACDDAWQELSDADDIEV